MSALATLARNEPTQEGARPPATVRPRAEPAKAAPGSDDHGPPVALRAADGADRDPAGGHDAPPPARGGHRKSLLIALAALAALATGNFTKIVQRIPVKIRLSVPDDLVGSLRPGASAVASISSRDEGRQPGAAAPDVPLIGHSGQGGGRQARLVPALPSPARP